MAGVLYVASDNISRVSIFFGVLTGIRVFGRSAFPVSITVLHAIAHEQANSREATPLRL